MEKQIKARFTGAFCKGFVMYNCENNQAKWPHNEGKRNMKHTRTRAMYASKMLMALSIVTLLAACEKTTIDTMSDLSSLQTVNEVRETLGPEDRIQFDAVMQYVAGPFALPDAPPSIGFPLAASLRDFNAMTGEEVLEYASSHKLQRFSGPRESAGGKGHGALNPHAVMASLRSNLTFSDLHLGTAKPSWRDRPLVVTIENNTKKVIEYIELSYSVESPSKAKPITTGMTELYIDGGLAPGEKKTVSTESRATYDLSRIENALNLHRDAKIVAVALWAD